MSLFYSVCANEIVTNRYLYLLGFYQIGTFLIIIALPIHIFVY